MGTRLARWALWSLLALPSGAWALFTDVYVFGDSLSDNGTAADALGVDYPFPYSSIPAQDINRVSNGPVAVEGLAALLGLPLNPSLFATSIPAVGTNYAVAGARAGRDQAGDLASQIGAFQANHLPGAPPDALYVLFIGGNDVLDISGEGDDAAAAVAITAATLGVETALEALIGAGARTLLVPNVFDIGLTPAAAADPLLASRRTAEYNAALAATLAGVEASQGIDLIEYDLFGLSRLIAGDPAAFGLTNIADPCTTGLPFPVFVNGCSVGVIDDFAFIDDIHPTATVHDIIGGALYAAVIPLPAALPLLGSALLVIGLWARRAELNGVGDK